MRGLPRFAANFVFFAVLWWILTEGSGEQAWLGATVAALATVATRMAPRERAPELLHGRAIFQFIPYFVYQSVRGGAQVAWLAFAPRSRIRSAYFDYPVRIPADAVSARMCFASALCVFPGTLSAGYHGDVLRVHALDEKLYELEATRSLEEITMTMFGLETGISP